MNFTKKWYHPELASVAVVGDFKVNVVENMIQEIFGKAAPSVYHLEPFAYEVNNYPMQFACIQDQDCQTPEFHIFKRIKLPNVTTKERLNFLLSLEEAFFSTKQRYANLWRKNELRLNSLTPVHRFRSVNSDTDILDTNMKPEPGKELESLKRFYRQMKIFAK